MNSVKLIHRIFLTEIKFRILNIDVQL